MKKKLLILGGIVVVIGVILGLSAIFRGEKTNQSACAQFILAIEAGDSDTSYAMFSGRTAKQQEKGAWKEQVKTLEILYSNFAPERSGNKTTADPITKQSSTSETYKIKSGSGPYRATCVIILDGDQNKIDSFTSEPDL